jgi:lipopolysaccharide biosynthesis glycosyltransferase
MRNLMLTVCCLTDPIWTKLSSRTHPTLKEYAKKIGVEFLSITESKINNNVPQWEKFQIYDLLDVYDRILYVDSDIIIKSDCPDLFSIVPSEKFGIFNEAPYNDTYWRQKNRNMMINVCNQTGIHNIIDYETEQYNTGVMVVSKIHKEIFKRPEIMPNQFLYDQPLLNTRILDGALNRTIEVHDIGYKFNCLTCFNFTDKNLSESYIIHYAGKDANCKKCIKGTIKMAQGFCKKYLQGKCIWGKIVLNGKTIGLVTRTMSRKAFLEKSLPTWCAIKEIDTISIVDWGVIEDLTSLLWEDDRINIIKVKDQEFFEDEISRNLGIRFTETDYIFMIDCDIVINKSPLCFINTENENDFYVSSKSPFIFVQKTPSKRLVSNHQIKVDNNQWRTNMPHTTGTSIFPKKMWKEVNGYAEGLVGYGAGDVDFYNRAELKGFKMVACMTPDYIVHQTHDNSFRTENRCIKTDILKSGYNNWMLLKNMDVQNQVQKSFSCEVQNNQFIKDSIII